MYPAVPPPKELSGRSVDFKLKPGWRYDEAKGVFVDPNGVEFAAPRLPKNSRVLYKVPSLARSAPRKLSGTEQDLQRYMQVICRRRARRKRFCRPSNLSPAWRKCI